MFGVSFPPDSETGSFGQGVRQPASSTVAATRLTRTVDSTGVGTAFGMLGMACHCGGTRQYLCNT